MEEQFKRMSLVIVSVEVGVAEQQVSVNVHEYSCVEQKPCALELSFKRRYGEHEKPEHGCCK